jgi:AcrR family transcriptional regulator
MLLQMKRERIINADAKKVPMVELSRLQIALDSVDDEADEAGRATSDRKQEILQCAIRLILENGMARLTIRRVAEAAGVSTGLVLYHFATKEVLIAEAWRLALIQSRDLIQASVGDVAGLDWMEAIFKIRFNEDGANVPWIFWLEYWNHAARTEDLRLHHSKSFMRMQELDAAQVEKAIAAGEIREDLDPALIVDLYHAVFCGLIVKVVLDRESITAERAMELGRFFLALMSPAEGSQARRKSKATTAVS